MHTVEVVGSRVQTVFVGGVCAMALDVSYRDDLRIFLAWRPDACLGIELARSWAHSRLQARFAIGTMIVEDAEASTVIGLRTVWNEHCLQVWPCCDDAWGGAVYHDYDNAPLRPWVAWCPPQQHVAVLRALMCRAVYLSSSRECRRKAMLDAVVLLACRAKFPWAFVNAEVMRRSGRWVPRAGASDVALLVDDAAGVLERVSSVRASCKSR